MSIESLHIPATSDTPVVQFDHTTGKLSIKGRSLPENAYAFFGPLIDWAKRYTAGEPESTEITVFLDYYNSSSGRYLLELLYVFEENLKNKSRLKVIWQAEEDDDLMIEKGEEMQSILEIPFEIVRVPGRGI